MPRARLSSKSQIVIPAEIRRKLGLKPGDEILMEPEDEHVVLRKAPKSALERLAEFGGPMWRGYAEEIERDRDEWDR
ncbi:MAG TPA: AbrB/MazE/SpoVT family DNA-binding domain-containing protein [Longimicrobiaceae bacterium]|nr:AbrB/MazE/SpoVT family DNA-binding domain-containing protein [Longimicrobiaceae bacterium]